MQKKKKIKKTLDNALKKRGFVGKRFNNSEYWKKYYFDKLEGKNTHRERSYAEFLSRICERGAVLDVATGYGFLPVEMRKLGFDVVGVDKYKEMIEMAGDYFKESGVNIKIIEADIVKLPFADKSYKLITAMSILEHFPEEEGKYGVLKELTRVLADDGCLFIHVPVKSAIGLLKRFYRIYIKRDLFKGAVDDDGDVTHKVWLDTKGYAKTLEQMGYKIEYVSFNFVRSNEVIPFFKFFNRIMRPFAERFIKVDGKMNIRVRIISMFAVSTAFICRKTFSTLSVI